MAQLPLISDPAMMQQRWKSLLDPLLAAQNVVTNWQQYPIAISASTANPIKGTPITDMGMWRQVGDSVEIVYRYKQTAVGSAGNGTYFINLPPSLSADYTKVVGSTVGGDAENGVGMSWLHDASGFDAWGQTVLDSMVAGGRLAVRIVYASNAAGSTNTTTYWGSTAFALGASISLTIHALVPIVSFGA